MGTRRLSLEPAVPLNVDVTLRPFITFAQVAMGGAPKGRILRLVLPPKDPLRGAPPFLLLFQFPRRGLVRAEDPLRGAPPLKSLPRRKVRILPLLLPREGLVRGAPPRRLFLGMSSRRLVIASPSIRAAGDAAGHDQLIRFPIIINSKLSKVV